MDSAVLPEYSLKEVHLHDAMDDAWVVLFNYVYDITPILNTNSLPRCSPVCATPQWLPTMWCPSSSNQPSHNVPQVGIELNFQKHPGGKEILLENIGRDASLVFLGGGHENVPLSVLRPYLIGILPKKEHLHLPYKEWKEREAELKQ